MTARSDHGSPKRQLGYDFEPVPKRARRARASGRLTLERFDLLAFLYGRADWDVLAERRETPRLTLEQIRRGLGYAASEDALYKLIQRTAKTPDDWFDVHTERAGASTFYVFKLKPDEPRRLSDLGPSAATANGPTATEPEPAAGDTIVGGGSPRVSAYAAAGTTVESPTGESGCPTPDDGARRMRAGNIEAAEVAPVRVSQKGQRENALSEEAALGTSALGSVVVPRSGFGIAAGEGVLPESRGLGEIMAAAQAKAVGSNGRPPLLPEVARPLIGDEMYPILLAEAARDGHLAHAEANEQYDLHKLVVDAGRS